LLQLSGHDPARVLQNFGSAVLANIQLIPLGS
jgi:hypothetical protein